MSGPMSTDFEVVSRVLAARRSCRGFTDQQVPRDTVERLLEAAQRTASWCNTQPWQLVVTSGDATVRLREALMASMGDGSGMASDLPFPPGYSGVYDERRKEVGWQLYEAVGVERGDRVGSGLQMLRNFEFFGAPHVAILTTEKDLGVYGAIDCGLYVDSFLLAAEALGLGTCAQAAVAGASPFLHEWFGIPASRQVVCGIAFGYPDPDHPSAGFTSRRAPLGDVVTFVD